MEKSPVSSFPSVLNILLSTLVSNTQRIRPRPRPSATLRNILLFSTIGSC
jgi:hypothetical protein